MTDNHLRLTLDFASAGAIVGTLAGWLPPLAALLAIIWYCILIYDRFVLKRDE